MAGLLFRKKKCLEVRVEVRLDLKESREGFSWRGRGRSFHVNGLQTETAQEPTAESLVQGIWRLRVSEAEQRLWEAA